MIFKSKSILVDKNVQNEELEGMFSRKFRSLNLGRRIDCGLHELTDKKRIKAVKKDGKLSYIQMAYFMSLTKNEGKPGEKFDMTRCFLVFHDSQFQKIMFVDSTVDHKNNTVEAVINDEHIPLKASSSIFDMNALRFELRRNKNAAQFMDDFIMPVFEDRKEYAEYEKEQLAQEQALLSAQTKFSGKV